MFCIESTELWLQNNILVYLGILYHLVLNAFNIVYFFKYKISLACCILWYLHTRSDSMQIWGFSHIDFDLVFVLLQNLPFNNKIFYKSMKNIKFHNACFLSSNIDIKSLFVIFKNVRVFEFRNNCFLVMIMYNKIKVGLCYQSILFFMPSILKRRLH